MAIIALDRNALLSMVRDALSDYFRPITLFIALFDKSFTLENKYKALQRRFNVNLVLLRIVQKAVCFNQGEYLQYTFLTAEKHKKLKDTFRDDPNDIAEIHRLTTDLMRFINSQFYEDTYENFKYLHVYFSKSRRGQGPRICIKANFRINDQEQVVSVFRDGMVTYDSDAEIQKNYGFKSIYETGTYYLENSIPQAVVEKRYFNQRLDPELVEEYLGLKRKTTVRSWDDCWIGGKADKSSFYKSTLIVPMTLWNNELSEEFKRLINLENVDRTIFGFLCFDHVEEDYFDEDYDVAIGYIFADIISMYIFTRLVYMEASKTFNKVEDWLHSRDADVTTESLSAIWKHMPRSFDTDKYLKFKPKKTANNKLFPIDEDLMKYVRSQVNSANK